MFNSRFLGKGSQSAAALLESTLVIPFLLTLVIALVFISVKLQTRSLMTNVTQEAARLMSRESSTGDECSYLENINNIQPESRPCSTGATFNPAVSKTHSQIYNLMKAMNDRDNKFKISSVEVQTWYSDKDITENIDTVYKNDAVYVRITANIEIDSILSNSFLNSIGLTSNKTTSISSQPYLLTKN